MCGFLSLPEDSLLTAIADLEHRKVHAILFTAAVISTCLTFHAVQELFLRAHMNLPLREDQFYKYQKSFVKFIGRYINLKV